MPTLNIEGRNVQVDDGFLGLSHDQQNATVEEIAKSFSAPHQAKLSDAVTDIPHEIGNAASEAIANIKGITKRGEQGPLEGLMTTGKAVLGIPQLLASPVTGAARSLIGHPMAQAEEFVGPYVEKAVQGLTGRERSTPAPTPERMYEAAKGDVDTAMSALASRGAPAVVPKVVAPTIPELKAAASGKAGLPGGYEGTELSSLEVKPTAISDFASKTKLALDAGGIDENLAPKTHAILSKLEKVPNSPSAVVTGNNIKSLRQLLGNASGEPGKEGLAAKRALDALDDHIPAIESKDIISGDPKAAGEALDIANANYSAAKHAETVDNKTIRAELRAAAVNSGHNVANTVRQRFADILNPEKPELRRGFNPDELAMMEQIVRGTRTQNALRWAGNYLGGGGGLGAQHMSAIGAGAGAAVGGVPGAFVGAAAPAGLGYILKAMGNRSTLKAAEQLSEAVRSRAPLASSMQKFQESATAFSGGQNARTYAAALIAARNLSANLRGAGINISPSDLLKGLQSPAPAQADDQQQVSGPPGQ
jgi:hypothetical protein